jgi:hypothetical protein
MSTVKANRWEFINGVAVNSTINVVQSTWTNAINTTSTSYVSTGRSLEIAPKSSTNKILITFTARLYTPSAGQEGAVAIYKNNSYLAGGWMGYNSAGAHCSPATLIWLDTPNTISPTTYSIWWRTSGGTFHFSPNGSSDSPQVLTLTEIQG